LKTRVITERVNWILKHGRIEAPTFLLLTFTNHAADVMKERIDVNAIGNVHASTFHSFCYKVLRDHGLMFTIVDEDDQKQILSKVCTKLNKGMKSIASILEHINLCKSIDGIYSKHIDICEEYDNYLAEHDYMDFGDLQIKALDYLSDVSYDHVLIDEFHDTSPIQMELIKKLEVGCRTLTVVCDDQQSIYGWRGADIQNILNFGTVYPSTVVITLNRNYRSTKSIVKSINNLITHANEKICDKELYTERKQGAEIYISECDDEDSEANLVADRIKKIYNKTKLYDNNLVLFRTNAQSRAVEYALLQMGIPYHLVAATSFYRRKEIKDVVAYLRYIANDKDEIALQRIINTPPRGIGKASIEKLTNQYGSLCSAISNITDLARINGKVYWFKEMIKGLRSHVEHWKIGDMIKNTLDCSQYLRHLQDKEINDDEVDTLKKSDDSKKRIGNIDSLLNNANYLQEKYQYSIYDYLGMVSLLSDNDSLNESGSVKIMTIHSAKGMEVDFVHVIGVENNMLPYIGCDISEERRLMYVAVSRAKEMCLITYCKRRVMNGRFMFTGRSMFIDQLIERK